MRHGYGRLLAAADDEPFHWTPGKIALSVFLFLAAGLCEIGGGWLIWHALRGGLVTPPERWWQSPKALLYVAAGGVTLVGYGFLPTLQPPPTFGRLYAVYGGFFIVLSYLWGWVVDKDRPDRGDPRVLPWASILQCFGKGLLLCTRA